VGTGTGATKLRYQVLRVKLNCNNNIKGYCTRTNTRIAIVNKNSSRTRTGTIIINWYTKQH